MSVSIPVAVGELFDKISILEIKSVRIKDEAKRANVQFELVALEAVRQREIAPRPELDVLYNKLREVNSRLWDIEDRIREQEHKRDFDAEFIELARSVYIQNDLRANIKREINQITGSAIMEEKSYA